MDITTLAAWGEFVGGIAVVVSLIYLASQIRQNSRLLRASTTGSTNQIMTTTTAILAQDAETAKIFWGGLADPDSLSEEERQRFNAFMTLFLQPARQQFQFELDGIGSPDEWHYHRQGIAWIARQPGLRRWWTEWGDGYSSEFRALVDGLIREGEAAG